MKIIFHYNPITFVLLGSGLADESPLESGVYLIPAHATDIEPPSCKQGFAPFWNGSGWDIKDVSLDEPKPEDPQQDKPKTYAELLEDKITQLEKDKATLQETVDMLVLSLL